MEFTSSPSPRRDRPSIEPKSSRRGSSIPHPKDSDAKRQQMAKAAAQTNTSRARVSKSRLSVILMLIAGLIGLAVWFAVSAFAGREEANDSPISSVPQFSSVTPEKVTIENLGGWKVITGREGENVYSYDDVIDTVDIRVSQQKMPSKSLEDIAKGFNAIKKLPTKDADAYIGTSAKGPQTVITTKNDALIFIMSMDGISDSSWVRYIESLKS